MKAWILSSALLLSALGARAEGMPQILGTDPLTRQILAKTAQENGGVTAAVRVGSGQVIVLKLPDATALPPAALAPAAASPALALKPAAGLAPKAAKAPARKSARRAVEQLKRVSVEKSWAEKR
jgi:hypothetical protein